MSISLVKGQKVSLTKEAPNTTEFVVGLGWDVSGKIISDETFDCDASMFILKNDNLDETIYFGKKTDSYGAIRHCGDNLTGEGDGDDEQIVVNLDRLPADINKLVIAVNIYAAYRRKQHFGMIDNAFVRLVDSKSGVEVLRYDLTNGFDGDTALIFGEFYRQNGEWKFNAIGKGTMDRDVEEIGKRYKKNRLLRGLSR